MFMLAIVIPYYKLTFFEATLQSLACQIDSRFKVYIGDDASPEDCSPLLEKFEGQFDFIYHRFESNLGGTSLTRHWERCIALSGEEEWLMILGDDDLLGETVVEEFYEHYDSFKGKTNVVRFASKILFEVSGKSSHIFTHPIWERATDSYYRKIQSMSRSSLSEHIFSRKSFNKYGFYEYPLAWNSDDRAWLDFSDKKPIYTINRSIVYVRVSDLNISGRNDNLLTKNLSEILFLEFLIKMKIGDYNKAQRLKVFARYISIIKRIRKPNIEEWIFLSFSCLKYFDFIYVVKAFKYFSFRLSNIFFYK